jgi:Carboxypeptidase regulatory-like domain/TonB-dependent Receptor Plug Domain
MRKLAFCLTLSISLATLSYAQSRSGNAGTVRGTVLDPSAAAIAGATVEIQNPVSHYDKSVRTDTNGIFEFDNIPFNNYHLSVSASGFQGGEQDINVRSPLPIEAKISLNIGVANQSVTVTTAGDLVETDPSTHTDVDRELFDKLPLESASSSLSSLVTLASPGVSADSNGLFHGFGDHASNSFSIDGQPITDQQSKVFSNQVPLDSVQSMEVIEGAPPAEYGGKTSLVIVVTTRSGLGATTPHGDVTASYGTFGSSNEGFDLAYGRDKWGNFISANGLNSGRFLDGPEYQVFHDHGNEENVFDRFDFKFSDLDTINLNLGFTRSWFQTPNSYDAETASAWNGIVVNNGGLGPNGVPVGSADQRSKIRTFNIAPVWTRLINPKTVFTLGAFVRQDQFNYYPSDNPFADLTPDPGFAGVGQSTSIGQNRRLTNLGGRASVSYVSGINNIKVGVQYEHTLLTERDTFGLVDPTGNAPCLNADGTPDTTPLITSQAGCTGGLQVNTGQGVFANGDPVPAFQPILGCYDLTRTGPLPASDGCPNNTSEAYKLYGHADIREFAFYIQDTINITNWTFNLGLRIDQYDGISSNWQPEPRLGIAYNIKPSNTVLRISYARTMESPFNENLVLASLGCTNPVVAAFQVLVPGGACVTTSPLSPGLRNEFHAGLSQALGKYLVLDGEYIWKYTHNAFDFSVLANTPITYPIEWTSSKIPGYAIRLSMPNFHGLTAFMVTSSVAARFFSPQVAGVGATPVGFGVFRIDHDEVHNATGHVQYQPKKNLPWIGFNWRYDSGLVAGPVPCAGGEACPNGPGGTDTMVSVLNLTPDQQFEGGLYCGSVHATPTMPISPNGLCPANLYGSTLVSIPAPGTQNNDHNPQRIAPRNLFDVAVGDDDLFHTSEKYKWSARLTVVNVTNQQALYNFLSTFSGTHYVSPRAITATVGFHF